MILPDRKEFLKELQKYNFNESLKVNLLEMYEALIANKETSKQLLNSLFFEVYSFLYPNGVESIINFNKCCIGEVLFLLSYKQSADTYTINDLAEMTGQSIQNIYKYIKLFGIGTKKNGSWQFTADDVNLYKSKKNI